MISRFSKQKALSVLIVVSFSSAYAAESGSTAKVTNHSWAGYHAGVDLGVQSDSANQTLSVNDPQQSLSGQGANADQGTLLRGDVKSARNLVFGGIHADYLLQENTLVYGVSASLMTGNCRNGDTKSLSLNDPTKAPYPSYFSNVSGQNCLNYLSAIKGKIGTAFGDTLLYIDGGLAFGRVKSKTSASITNVVNPPSDIWTGTNKKTLTGYIVGAGAQYAFDKNISIGLNISHYDLGKLSYSTKPDAFTADDQPGVNQSINGHARGNLVQLAIDYQY